MLVFISDLHFVDGTAGEHNLPAQAFKGVFNDLAEHARKAKAKDIKIIFLGDIFDLLRTEKWFDPNIKEDARPWGTNETKIEINAKNILQEIISKNKDTFDFLKGNLKELVKFEVEPERIYIPGNHDRLCNKYESLREIIRENLNIKDKKAGENFDHSYLIPEYGVLARHGHEFDVYNYEAGEEDYNSFDAHITIPIGDPITTELVAKIPWEIKRRLEKINNKRKKNKLPVDQIYRNFQDIENVRPMSAVVDWLFYQVQTQDDTIKKVVEEAIESVIKEFDALSYILQWYDKHDKWYTLLDEADRIQIFLGALRRFKFDQKDRILSVIERVKDIFSNDDKHVKAAIRDCSVPANVRYVVYGHTHEPMQKALRVSGETQQIYFNTGTWRARHRRCDQGEGFITWKNLTYVIFYSPEESGKPHPTSETWTGTLKED